MVNSLTYRIGVSFMKRIISMLVICAVLFWCGRIYSINQISPIIYYYDIGDVLECGDLELYFAESYLDDPNEFNNRFGIDYVPLEDEYKMLSICIEVTNVSDDNIKWNDIFGFLEYGFESSVWASSVDPMVGPSINKFSSEYLSAGESQKIWFSTEIQKACFKDSSWDNVDDYQYLYVLTLVPHKIAVRLEI